MDSDAAEPHLPFAGAERRSDFGANDPAGSGVDLGTLLGGILRGLATAGSQPRSTGRDASDTAGNQDSSTTGAGGSRGTGNTNRTFRTGTNQVGPMTFTWGTESYQTTTTTRSDSGTTTTNTHTSTSDNPFAGRSPMGLNE
jgi:hypothetical protein